MSIINYLKQLMDLEIDISSDLLIVMIFEKSSAILSFLNNFRKKID